MNNRIAIFAGVALAFVFLSGFANAVGITDGTFRSGEIMDNNIDIEQGKAGTAVVVLTNSPNRNNSFAVAVGGEIAGWVTNISPNYFNLSAGATKSITITIIVPSDASVREYKGTVTATGTQIIGGGTVGYQEAAQGTLYLYVKKSGSTSPVINTTTGGSGGGSNNTSVSVMVISFCTADAYLCPDGTYVSRNPNKNCAFFACPNSTIISANITPSNTSSGGGSSNASYSNTTSGGGSGVALPSNISSGGAKMPANNTTASPAIATLPAKCGAWKFSKCEESFAIFRDECGNELKDGCAGCAEMKDGNGLPSYGCSSKIAVSSGKMLKNETAYYNVSIIRNSNISSDEGILQVGSASADYTGKVEVRESKIMMNTSAGERQILVMPADAIRISGIAGNASMTVELKEKSSKAVYSVTGARQARLFFIIPVSMEISADVDAETGNVISVSKPWWSFLTR